MSTQERTILSDDVLETHEGTPMPLKLTAYRRLLFFLAAVSIVWFGCSVQKNYKLLSFFFDGVPDPAILEAGKLSLDQARAIGATIYTHEPYALALLDETKCSECHRTRNGAMVTQIDSRVCMKCHAAEVEEHAMMHGPVAASACLWCHAPHESTNKHLLRVPSPQLCQQCHGPTHMGAPRSQIHQETTLDCLDCHSGHGGSSRFFLKELAPK